MASVRSWPNAGIQKANGPCVYVSTDAARRQASRWCLSTASGRCVGDGYVGATGSLRLSLYGQNAANCTSSLVKKSAPLCRFKLLELHAWRGQRCNLVETETGPRSFTAERRSVAFRRVSKPTLHSGLVDLWPAAARRPGADTLPVPGHPRTSAGWSPWCALSQTAALSSYYDLCALLCRRHKLVACGALLVARLSIPCMCRSLGHAALLDLPFGQHAQMATRHATSTRNTELRSDVWPAAGSPCT